MNRSRRKLSPEFKAKVAMAALKGDRTLSELSSHFDVHPNQIMTWKKQLIENAVVLFSRNPRERGDTGTEIKELHAKIGQLTMERDFLADGLGLTTGPHVKR